MRLPFASQLDTRDGASNKDARMTNALKTTNSSGTAVAALRPGLGLRSQVSGAGNGLVSFDGELLSIYGATIGYATPDDIEEGDVGDLGDGSSICTGASRDGSVIVGSSPVGGVSFAFSWTFAGGIVNLGTLPGGTNSSAAGVSGDGKTVVGYSLVGGKTRAFKYDPVDGMVDIGALSALQTGDILDDDEAVALAISTDGTTIVGYSYNGSSEHAFVWRSNTGMLPVPPLPAHINNRANGVSSNGEFIVGSSGPFGAFYPFLYVVSSRSLTNLGIPEGKLSAEAYGVSFNGAVVVGVSNTSIHKFDIKWTATDGEINQGSNLGNGHTAAKCVSEDGTIIGGAFYGG